MENKNGQGIFYGVIGVATLVVAIIGATFAYFSASTSAGNGTIAGNTLDLQGTALALAVTPVSLGSADNGPALVPANIEVSTNGVQGALNAHCIDGKYTGCHVYQIKATAGTALTDAVLTLEMNTSATVKTDWAYIIYTDANNTGTTASALPSGLNGNFSATNPTTVTILNGTTNASLAAGDTYWYLMIYLADDTTNAQNDPTDTANLATGTYDGSLTLSAGTGGKVSATFAAAA